MEITEPNKIQALSMMLEGKTHEFIAKELDVNTRTLRRWADEPEFAATLKEEREAVLSIAQAQAAAILLEEVEEQHTTTRFLAAIRDNERAPIQVRMRAAGMLMNNFYKAAAFMMKQEKPAKADKTGHRTERASGQEPVSQETGQNRTSESKSPDRPNPTLAETGQNRTSAPAQSAIRNPQSAIPPSAMPAPSPDKTGHDPEVLRQKALKSGEAELAKLDRLEEIADKSEAKGADPAATKKMRDDIENARQAIESTMDALETASPAELHESFIQTNGRFLESNMKIPA